MTALHIACGQAPGSSENLYSKVRLDSDKLVWEPALGSTDPAPSEASVHNCSKIVLVLLCGLSPGPDLMGLMG